STSVRPLGIRDGGQCAASADEREVQREPGAPVDRVLRPAAKLPGEAVDYPDAEIRLAAQREVARQADAIVLDREGAAAAVRAQRHRDGPLAPAGEGVLAGIGQYLVRE